MDRQVGARFILAVFVLTHSNTDNYLMLLSHFTRQNGVEATDVRAYLGVDEEYEDLEA